MLNCYCSLAQINAEKIYPVFEKRFPGIKINHVDATSDKLSARAITEARGGKTLADVVEFGLEDINKIHEQGLILDKAPPEAAAYPANLKGPVLDRQQFDFLRRRLEYRQGEEGRRAEVSGRFRRPALERAPDRRTAGLRNPDRA